MIRARITFRPHSWFDRVSRREKFGVQAKIAGRRGWMHVADGEPLKAMIFTTAKKRDKYLEQCRHDENIRREAENKA